jgi:phage tail-like protein
MDANGLKFWMLSQRNDWPLAWRANALSIKGQTLVDLDGHIQTAQAGGISGNSQPAWASALGAVTVDSNVPWINSGPTQWQANTIVGVGQFVRDSSGNLQVATAVAGNSKTGATQPAWPTTVNQSVVDGDITWTFAGLPQQGLFYCRKTNRLQLLSANNDPLPAEDYPTAAQRVKDVPWTRDKFGNYARWDASSGHVAAGGSGPGEVPIYAPPVSTVSDLVLGSDDILYVAVGGTLVLIDRRDRWPSFMLGVPDFKFWRLAARPEGGVLALDRDNSQLGVVTGQPLQVGPADTPNPAILPPCQANPYPPQIVARYPLTKKETFIAITAMDQGQFSLLSWDVDAQTNKNSYLRTFTEDGGLGARLQLGPNPTVPGATGAQWPYSIAWIGEQQIAALVTNAKEALIFDLDLQVSGDQLIPAGEFYVLSAADVGPFAHGSDLPPYYTASNQLLPLLPLSLNSFSDTGATGPGNPAIFDSGTSQTVWHRMFVEAVIPPRCGALIWLAASDTRSDLTSPATIWYPHAFGTADTSSISSQSLPDLPHAVWQTFASEVAFAQALLQEEPVPNRQGLFMVLVQRMGTAVRSMRGRYLGVRVQLNGDQRNTPEIAALRVYAPRFSYVDHYLPEIYREDTFGPEADQPGPSTRPDFFERFVDLFEDQMTRMEDRVANAYLLTRPESSPDDSLDWLGGWIGIDPDSYPPDRRRDRLLNTPDLYRQRGTAKGITLALDIATQGMCSRGAIIVIEDFRLRHIFATILGADLSIKDDPLLPGYSGSSNSMVGDTLFLGDPRVQAELQALFAKNLNIPGSQQAAQALYDQLAHRLTIFVHDQVEKVDLMLVQRIVEAEKPAHVMATLQRATQPFMIGLASLVGVNTYLGKDPPRGTATVDTSRIGRYDVVTHLPSLDPRLENGLSAAEWGQPVARLSGPTHIMENDTIQLDGSASTAPPGRSVVMYRWSLVQA